jgi:hypothetical protein
MLLGLTATAIVAGALLWDLGRGRARALTSSLVDVLRRNLAAARERSGGAQQAVYDPGRELRAEQRARALLRSCVNEEEWSMYRDLGFVRVWGGGAGAAEARYAYLIYPHRPIVAFVPSTGALLSEYCVAFPDHSRPYGSTRLPDADDVLAKWMALTADERRLIADANMHLPGRQLDPEQVHADLGRLARWERERPATRAHTRACARAAGSRNELPRHAERPPAQHAERWAAQHAERRPAQHAEREAPPRRATGGTGSVPAL